MAARWHAAMIRERWESLPAAERDVVQGGVAHVPRAQPDRSRSVVEARCGAGIARKRSIAILRASNAAGADRGGGILVCGRASRMRRRGRSTALRLRRQKHFFLMVVGLIAGAGCMSFSEPPNNREPEYSYWDLIEPNRQARIPSRLVRSRSHKGLVPRPLTMAKSGFTSGSTRTQVAWTRRLIGDHGILTIRRGRPLSSRSILMAWSNAIKVGSTESAIAERQKLGILFGVYYDRSGRVRADDCSNNEADWRRRLTRHCATDRPGRNGPGESNAARRPAGR